MWIKNLDPKSKIISVAIPLTKATGKIRIKKRNNFNEYGIPVPTKAEAFSPQCYVEWQIGYDVAVKEEEKLKLTTIKDCCFIGANGKEKTLYELSEYIFYFYQWKVIPQKALLQIKEFLENLKEEDFIENSEKFAIERSRPAEKKVSGTDFSCTQVKYPMLVHQFNDHEVLAEIKVTEKQYAVGIQPMLYFCFPVTELADSAGIIGRTATAKENADFNITAQNIGNFLEMLKIFGILSARHNHDVISIIDKILEKA